MALRTLPLRTVVTETMEKNLDSLAGAFLDLDMNADGVTNVELGQLLFHVLAGKSLHEIHKIVLLVIWVFVNTGNVAALARRRVSEDHSICRPVYFSTGNPKMQEEFSVFFQKKSSAGETGLPSPLRRAADSAAAWGQAALQAESRTVPCLLRCERQSALRAENSLDKYPYGVYNTAEQNSYGRQKPWKTNRSNRRAEAAAAARV